MQELQQAELEQDFNDIRTELTEGGYLRGRGKKQPGFQRASRPREFRSTAGLRILVGRSNRQNDRLTCKDADRRDIWFHTQKIHGSHVILWHRRHRAGPPGALRRPLRWPPTILRAGRAARCRWIIPR